MYPKHFFENFWEGEQINQLFTGMSFEESLNARFEVINKVAKSVGFERAYRVDIEKEAKSIPYNTLENIANSKLLIFDLSFDDRYKTVNPNVMFELGLATAIREPSDIILIGKKNQEKMPFDIETLTINFFDIEINEEDLKEILENAMAKQQWYKSKRVKATAKTIDEIGLQLMATKGTWPKKYSHFSLPKELPEQKIAIFRLMDLGILRFECKYRNAGIPLEYAYHWTQFGRAVMEHLGIKEMIEDEFKKSPYYSEAMKAEEEYAKWIKSLEKLQ